MKGKPKYNFGPPKADLGLELGISAAVVALASYTFFSVIRWTKPKR